MSNKRKNAVIYYDNNNLSSWLDTNTSSVIRNYFDNKGFQVVDSAGLRDWMSDVIEKNEAERTVLVFSQDIVPCRVFDKPDFPLIRQFMDLGGVVVWFGDVPFFYIYVDNELKNDCYRCKNYEKCGECSNKKLISFVEGRPETLSHINIFGVIPVFMSTPTSFKISRYGKKAGLKTSWNSLRPILKPSTMETMPTRIKNYMTHNLDFIGLAEVEGLGSPMLAPITLKGPIGRFLDWLGISSIQIQPISLTAESDKQRTLIQGHFYSSWIKKIGKGAFVRFWDFSPHPEFLQSGALDEVYSVLQKYFKNKLVKGSLITDKN